MNSQLVTIVVAVREGLANIEAQLDAWGNPLGSRGVAGLAIKNALDALRAVHFMGIHIIPAADGGSAHLVFELALDDSPRAVLEQLESACGPQLRSLIAAAGYPIPEAAGPDYFPVTNFLLNRRQLENPGRGYPAGLNFCGLPGFSVKRILAENQLAKQCLRWLEEVRAHSHQSPSQRLELVRQRVWSHDAFKWALVEEPVLAERGGGGNLRAAVRGIVPLLRELLWPALIPPALCGGSGFALAGAAFASFACAATLGLEVLCGYLAYRKLRELERTDPEDVMPESVEARNALLALEDKCEQNHLIVLTQLKPGALRRFTLRLAFLAVRQAVQDVFAPGKLANIGTIHFARWILLPGTSQLLFLSNYGGSWESYLEDFIIKAHEGLTAIWSNTRGFPRAKNLFDEGATHGSLFKTWARRHQLPTRFWYTAYPDLTTSRIRTNAAIRRGLAAARSEADAANWLALLGGPAPTQLHTANIPGLVFRGTKRLTEGRCLLFRFEQRENFENWLQGMKALVTYGEDPRHDHSVQLGFSIDGLRSIGLHDETLATFPIAFQQGPAARSQALGDRGDDSPEGWRWGGPRTEAVDAIVLVYAHSRDALNELLGKISPTDPSEQRMTIDLSKPAHDSREPFGFVDGISQPILRGTRRAHRADVQDHLVAPGEVVLGYPDESTFLPPSPRLVASEDLPTFDLGRDGTYLVVRQLQQDVQAFDEYAREQAAHAISMGAATEQADAEAWVKAKMLGRWPNGSSLVRHPHRPGPNAENDNQFKFAAEDPQGMACPIGAHIRRANPRDSFDVGGSDPTRVIRRHRILRVGRPYQGSDRTRGLMFMCFNADIERQFEFVQQAWLRGRSFTGLSSEIDPIQGQRDGTMTVPTLAGPLVLKGMRQFVKVVGSGYFFVPGRACLERLASLPKQANDAEPAAPQIAAE
jgi:Dyp-type peroxidase family